MSNVEAWISPETDDAPMSARDRIAERLRGRPDPVALKQQRAEIEQRVADIWGQVPERTRQLEAEGLDYSAALKRARDEAQTQEDRLRAATNNPRGKRANEG